MAKTVPEIYRALWKEPLLHFGLIGAVGAAGSIDAQFSAPHWTDRCPLALGGRSSPSGHKR